MLTVLYRTKHDQLVVQCEKVHTLGRYDETTSPILLYVTMKMDDGSKEEVVVESLREPGSVFVMNETGATVMTYFIREKPKVA